MSSAGLNPRLRDWHGQGVWIVGASSGIGLATAEALAVAGARVVVSARKAGPLQDFAARHAGALALPCRGQVFSDSPIVKKQAQAV